jgi:hypothetical protein
MGVANLGALHLPDESLLADQIMATTCMEVGVYFYSFSFQFLLTLALGKMADPPSPNLSCKIYQYLGVCYPTKISDLILKKGF